MNGFSLYIEPPSYTIIMFQCKIYLNTDLVLITMLVCLSVEFVMLSAYPVMDWYTKQYSTLIVSSTILI